MKKHVVPGGKILFTGNVFDEPLEFSARTTGVALKRFFDQAPGWAGLDTFGCVERDEGHTECRFGGGGTHFIVKLVPSPSRTRWYVAEVFGDEH